MANANQILKCRTKSGGFQVARGGNFFHFGLNYFFKYTCLMFKTNVLEKSKWKPTLTNSHGCHDGALYARSLSLSPSYIRFQILFFPSSSSSSYKACPPPRRYRDGRAWLFFRIEFELKALESAAMLLLKLDNSLHGRLLSLAFYYSLHFFFAFIDSRSFWDNIPYSFNVRDSTPLDCISLR